MSPFMPQLLIKTLMAEVFKRTISEATSCVLSCVCGTRAARVDSQSPRQAIFYISTFALLRATATYK